MSRDSSPPPLSDDSAVGSMASAATNLSAPINIVNYDSQPGTAVLGNAQPTKSMHGTKEQPQQNQNNHDYNRHPSYQHLDIHNQTHTENNSGLIKPGELRLSASRMRYNNTTLTSRSIRTNLSCFNDLDIQRFESSPDYLVNFISIGINKSQHYIHRPVSILWPDTYDKMIDELAKLDAYLINTEYKEKPIDWMICRSLTSAPDCRQCKDKMTLRHDRDSVKWHCRKTAACQNLYAPVLRPSTFKGYENVGLMKLLFSIYYWATCTQCDLLYGQLRLEPDILHGIWRNIQNVCRVALEKSYPRFRLCNSPDSDNTSIATLPDNQAPPQPIDLVSIKFNGNFIVCAKHPKSNCVRLGLWIPKVSQYSFAELTESWFAHGAHVRVCETKFMDLKRLRSDLKINLVTRFQMVTKDKSFNRHSAFGYLVCQLTHLFKDFDSSAVTLESLKLILAELEWRELYGTTPFDAFTKIVEHMATYRCSTDCYYESTTTPAALQEVQDDSDYIYAEKYFYATSLPVDKNGMIIQRFGQNKDNQDEVPAPVIQFRCHICQSRFESFYFSMHMVAHVEKNRKEDEEHEYAKSKRIKCKHCFRLFTKREIMHHSKLFNADHQNTSFGCRICCIKFGNRARYLEHMRRYHFEHEMPYRCPKCKFASSFQRELFIHFQEEHQLEFIILCPFCNRSFTVVDPSKMDDKSLDEISRLIYKHILEHYLLANSYACDNCCLTFLDQKSLLKHKIRHHDSAEIFSNGVTVQPFIVTRSEEHFCVQAMPMELFIPNKQPNVAIDEASHHAVASTSTGSVPAMGTNGRSNHLSDNSSDDDDDDDDEYDHEKNKGIENRNKHKRPKTMGSISKSSLKSTNTVADKFLAGGEASLRINTKKSSDLTTEIIIDLMLKFKRADCIIPNQSVLLHPEGGPLKCLDCGEHFTVDHLVSAIPCRPCKYSTYCPRALTKHKLEYHSDQ